MTKIIASTLEEIFNEISTEMRSRLEKSRKALLKQPRLKGNEAEEILLDFLRQYLPKTLGLTNGLLIDSKGNRSNELDIVIYDEAKTPIFYKSKNIQVIPAECAYSVIEVKTKLDKKELIKIFTNMESVRKLDKSSFYPEGDISHPITLYGREWPIWPINYFVFAYESINLEDIVTHLEKNNNEKNLQPNQQIDLICVLDKGVIHYVKNGKWGVSCDPESAIMITKTGKSLLLFYSLLSRFVNQMIMPKFNFIPYVEKINFDVL